MTDHARDWSATCCRGRRNSRASTAKLLQIPRNLDVRLLHYRRDLIAHGPTHVDGAHRNGGHSV